MGEIPESATCTAGARALPAPISLARVRPDSPMSKRARRASARARTASSPVSVETVFAVTDEQKRTLQPLTTLTLLIVYSELVRQQLWYAAFGRGRRDRRTGEAVQHWERKGHLRSLATRHLTEPCTDGWNCVAGAVALANAWAFQTEDIPEVIPAHFQFSLATRLRLAVCLSVAWKFQRATCSHFQRRFDTAKPSLLGPHTHELANLGYFFMTLPEQEEFGGWGDKNVEAIRALYEDLITLEVDLITSVNLFSLLTETPLDWVESRAATLLERDIVSAECAMAIRSLAPLFIYCTSGAESVSAGALVCASMFALGVASNANAPMCITPELMHAEFTHEERIVAWGLLQAALEPNKMAELLLSATCYNDSRWEHHRHVTPHNLRAALSLASLTVG